MPQGLRPDRARIPEDIGLSCRPAAGQRHAGLVRSPDYRTFWRRGRGLGHEAGPDILRYDLGKWGPCGRRSRSHSTLNRHDEALQVLLVVRRRLLDRLASVVVERRSTLLNGGAPPNNPLAASADLVEIIKNLDKLENAIAGLAAVTEDDLRPAAMPPPAPLQRESRTENIFAPYCRFVSNNRLEQAARELSKVLHMPQDQMITATRFFTRAVKADPSLVRDLAKLCEPARNWTDSDCVRTLIKTFGFQAVESRRAMQTLRDGSKGPSPIPA